MAYGTFKHIFSFEMHWSENWFKKEILSSEYPKIGETVIFEYNNKPKKFTCVDIIIDYTNFTKTYKIE